MDNARELALLDRLNERIGKLRKFKEWDEIIVKNDQFSMGIDRGVFLALLEIADMKREIENGKRP